MYNGIINIYKERGCTSHDVVNRLRRILGQKKIGHTGTLDPDAEGVLPVCLGCGTKLCDRFAGDGKEYRVTLLLGLRTDTQDLTGQVLEERPVDVTEEAFLETVSSFVGEYDQVPPMYSAIKFQGRKLYDLARAGIEVERKSRRIRIERIVTEKLELPQAQLLVSCSKGTYIRTLCEDIGNRLGCGGCMKSLIRTRSGPFSIEDSIRLDEAARLKEEGSIEEHIIPVDTFFMDSPAATPQPPDDLHLLNGNPFQAGDLLFKDGHAVQGSVRMYDSGGCFVGLYRFDARRESYVPEKMYIPLQEQTT